MMVKAKGPVWHKKQKEKNLIPENLRGLDKEATWSFSQADRWIYGHGTYCETSHDIPVVLNFKWMINSGNESKKMFSEALKYKNKIDYLCMDSKADDEVMFQDLKGRFGITLLTSPRKNMDKTERRKKFIAQMKRRKHKRVYRERSITVEPMQSLMKDIFNLDQCWMRRDENNRWIFAAMGVAVQMAQLSAFQEGSSTWKVKSEVLGE